MRPEAQRALLDVIDDEASLLTNMVANGNSDKQKVRESLNRLAEAFGLHASVEGPQS